MSHRGVAPTLSPKDWMVFEIGKSGGNLKAHKFRPYLIDLP